MTHQILTEQRLRELNSPSAVLNVISAILERATIEIIKFVKEMGRGKCPWVHYQLANGRRLATFISPKAFRGYQWFENFSKVVNMESGEIYQVSDRHCTCKSWEYHVKRRKRKTCKHQRMRQLEILRHKFPVVNLSDSLPSIPQKSHSPQLKLVSKPQSQPTPVKKQERSNKIDLSSLKEGLTLERTSDRTLIEYYLKAWHKNTPLSAPALKKLGSISETEEGFMVATIGIKAKVLKRSLEDAIDWIFREIGSTYALVYEAYIEAMNLKKAIA